jgi:predicted nucleic acid-binding protein
VSGWLLDTNVISELRRPRPSARVRSFIAGQPLDDLFVSTVTFAEIRYGIETVGDPVRRAELHDWLMHKVRPMFDQRVLEVSEDVMFMWRLLVEEGRKVGPAGVEEAPDLEGEGAQRQQEDGDEHIRQRRQKIGAQLAPIDRHHDAERPHAVSSCV